MAEEGAHYGGSAAEYAGGAGKPPAQQAAPSTFKTRTRLALPFFPEDESGGGEEARARRFTREGRPILCGATTGTAFGRGERSPRSASAFSPPVSRRPPFRGRAGRAVWPGRMLVARRVALPWLLLLAAGRPRGAWSVVWYSAWVTTVYTEPGANRTLRGSAESGRYADGSPRKGAQGLVGIPRGLGARRMEGCAPDVEYEVPLPPGASRGSPAGPPPAWIALVAHGGCRLKEKIANAARKAAVAVVIYNEPQFGNSTLTMPHLGTGNTVVIMVGYPKGMEILEPVRRGIPVKMTIDVGNRHIQEYISGQSVVFLSIAFITMMIISLAWLIFFYIQRFLYAGTQFGNQGHRKEIRKAIDQLQLHIVKHENKRLDIDAENCSVCIENYKPKDTVRILPCKHIFHRACIDPWLLDHRTCPMCKLDVIKALGCWGEPKDLVEAAVPESLSGSVSVESWSIDVQEDRNELSSISASSTHESTLNCSRLKEDLGERAALLEMNGRDGQLEEHLSSENSQ